MNQNTVRRNDHCPCGSGQKYKNCCGREGAKPPQHAVDPNALLQQALRHHQTGQLPQAENLYRQILAVRPSDANALQLLGLIHHQNGLHAIAADLMGKSVAQNANVAEWQVNLGTVHAALDNQEAAERHYRAAIRINPQLAGAHASLGGVLLAQYQAIEAAVHLRAALRLDPALPEAELNLGIALHQQGKFDEAAEHYRKALQLQPDYPEAWYNLGNTLMSADKLDQAADAYRQALALRADYDKAWVNAAMIFRQCEQPRPALEALRRAYLAKPGSNEWHPSFVQILVDDFADKQEIFDWHALERASDLSAAPDDGKLVSFIVCSIDERKLAALSADIARHFAAQPFEIIAIRDAASLCEGYNRGVRLARGDYLVFCHDDIEILAPDFAVRLKLDLQTCDIVGVAGTTLLCGSTWVDAGWPHIHGIVALPPSGQGRELIVYAARQRAVAGIQALDGLFFAVRREVMENLSFDEKLFDGFHFYDLDFTYRAHLAGYRLAVCSDLLLAHHSRGSFDDAWRGYAEIFLNKHRATLPARPVSRPASPAVKLPGRREAWVFAGGLAAFAETQLPPGSAQGEAHRRADLMSALAGCHAEWLRLQALKEEAAYREMARLSAELPRRPLISLLMPVYDTPEAWLREAIESVLCQAYPHWELCIVDDASPQPHVRDVLEEYRQRDPRIKVAYRSRNGRIAAASNDALALASGEFVALLDHDDVLERHALFRLAQSIAEDRPDMIYSDEALVSEDSDAIHGFFFRPTFSLELLRAHPYIVHLTAFRASLLREIGGFDATLAVSQDYDLILRAAEKAATIVHIPEVLYRWRIHAESAGHRKQDEVMASSTRILQDHLARCGEDAMVTPGSIYNFFDIRYPLQDGLRVAIVIPTKNHGELVRQCVESLERTVKSVAYDIVLVDHASDDSASLAYFAELGRRHQVLRYQGPFNFSIINNWAVARLERPYSHYLLCNNDIEAISEGWLERMLELGQHEDVGIVGAKLYYPDGGTIQHAGVCVGMYGLAEHYGKFMDKEIPGLGLRPGYIGSLIANREISAVTAACMLIRSDAFAKVGGLDEEIAVGFGDIDLCLRVRQAGYRVMFSPHAELLHHESFTRGKPTGDAPADPHPEDTALFLERWGAFIDVGDPYYNPNLPLDNTSWILNSLHAQRRAALKAQRRRVFRKDRTTLFP